MAHPVGRHVQVVRAVSAIIAVAIAGLYAPPSASGVARACAGLTLDPLSPSGLSLSLLMAYWKP
jgi:hypothetical protein